MIFRWSPRAHHHPSATEHRTPTWSVLPTINSRKRWEGLRLGLRQGVRHWFRVGRATISRLENAAASFSPGSRVVHDGVRGCSGRWQADFVLQLEEGEVVLYTNFCGGFVELDEQATGHVLGSIYRARLQLCAAPIALPVIFAAHYTHTTSGMLIVQSCDRVLMQSRIRTQGGSAVKFDLCSRRVWLAFVQV